MKDRIKIITVLRSGRHFKVSYLENLKNALDRVLKSKDWDLVCFTDHNVSLSKVEVEQLTLDVPHDWSRLEVFRYMGPCLYIDIDSVIVSDFSEIFNKIMEMSENEFWTDDRLQTSIMAWNGDFTFLFDDLRKAEVKKSASFASTLLNTLRNQKVKIDTIQQYMRGVYLYQNCKSRALPADAAIVQFEGTQPLNDLTWMKWIKMNWLGEE